MDRSSLNQLDIHQAAGALALRRAASQQIGGLVKESDIKETLGRWLQSARDWGGQAGDALKTVTDPIGTYASDIMSAKPDLQAALNSGNMTPYWSASAKEALRNALLGGGIGGGIGALKGIISGDDILQNMLMGGLGGAALGGAGTGLYRGLGALGSGGTIRRRQQQQEAAAAKAMDDRASAIEDSPGTATMGDRAATSWEQITKGDPTRGMNIWTNNPSASGMLSRGLTGGNVMANEPGQRNFGSAERALGYGGAGYATGHLINRGREWLHSRGQRSHARRTAAQRAATRTAIPGISGGNMDRVHPYRQARPHLGRRLPTVLGTLGALYGAWEGGQPIGHAPADRLPFTR
jgi:hypothetical protein